MQLRKTGMRAALATALTSLALLAVVSAFAWGPHPAITQAALDVLAPNDALIRQLGNEAQRLTNYAWMADFRRLPFEEPNEFFYTDDYLIFPGVTKHLDHIVPEVKQTFRPYFNRALQALRTENAPNAARWIGSLLHFVEDTGSPPHAAQIRGDPHIKMENWVDAKAIHIADYRPQLFGSSDEEAMIGFLKRMDELIEFSKVRARKLQIPVTMGNRRGAMPLVLESALETGRVTADLLHTLGTLSRTSSQSLAALRGTVRSQAAEGPVGQFPAKVVLEGTPYSTLADLAGHFEFRNLPPGNYQVYVLRPGSGLAQQSVTLVAGETNECVVDLPKADANLVRNGDFKLHWAKPDAPDCWNQLEGAWEGEVIPLKIGQRYRLTAKFKQGSNDSVLVRWTQYLPHAVPRTAPVPRFQTRTLTPADNQFEFTGTQDLGLVQIILRSKGPPGVSCDYIRLVPITAEQK